MDTINKVVIFDYNLAFKFSLPEVANLFIAPIKVSGVGAQKSLHKLSQIFKFFCFSNQMYVIRHKAETIKQESASFLVPSQSQKIDFVVFFF